MSQFEGSLPLAQAESQPSESADRATERRSGMSEEGKGKRRRGEEGRVEETPSSYLAAGAETMVSTVGQSL